MYMKRTMKEVELQEGEAMIRYNVYLTEKQLKELGKLANEQNRPVARLIREAVDQYLTEQWRHRSK